MHTLLFRNWKTRVKGRDWYDFEWYIRHNVSLDFTHLQIKTKEFNGMDMDKRDFTSMLKERLSSTDIAMVKRDVLPFIQNPKELDIWSNDYFLQLADRVKLSSCKCPKNKSDMSDSDLLEQIAELQVLNSEPLAENEKLRNIIHLLGIT